jgi:hypothetical protein
VISDDIDARYKESEDMTLSVITEFAKFLRDHGYTTRMWEGGFSSDDVNQVCHELTGWGKTTLGLTGEFIVLWSAKNGIEFSGDSELIYTTGEDAHLIPNPFIEGDSEGFVTAVTKIVQGFEKELYPVELRERILYNAV